MVLMPIMPEENVAQTPSFQQSYFKHRAKYEERSGI